MPAGTGRVKKAPDDGNGNKKKSNILKLAKNETGRSIPMEDLKPDDVVFAFDIGTRSVVGVVGIQENGRFRIIATEILEHRSRAMMDGQIHDIDQVAAIAKEVKARLEARLGITLKRVAIAAAGRALKTSQVKVEKDLDPGVEIDRELVSSIEIEGIQQAQARLDADGPDGDGTQYYCVGYSVINYYLNGYVISNLTGHRGKTAGADILATFLPHMVVDSLYTVINRIGLEVSSLTLEPIAAINVTIPPDLRLLNLALVDIGAGTSDIALTKDGSIIAYAMVPVAGDEITEKISQHYLVDFNTAEKIKLALSTSRESINFTDILKIKHSVAASEVSELIRPAVEQLAETIAGKILEYNHKSPNAVFLIGGGSQIPGLSGLIAARLELAQDRVVVRGRDVIRDVKFSDRKLSGPESITPYGIAVTAQMQSGRDFMSVTVNDKKIRLFNSKRLSVADALVLIGFNPGRLIGRSGKSVSFTVNGERKLVRGEYGRAAEIYVNGAPASLESPIGYGDNIRVVEAVDGRNAEVRVSDVVDDRMKGKVTLNGRAVDISADVTINGVGARDGSFIQDGDYVGIYRVRTLGDLLKAEGIEAEKYKTTVNGAAAGMDHNLKDADVVECVEVGRKAEKTAGPAPAAPGSPGALEGPALADISALDTSGMFDASWVRLTVNGREMILKENKTQYIFVDVFNYIDFDLTKPKGNIMLKLNGHVAAFTDVIGTGDIIEIYWQN